MPEHLLCTHHLQLWLPQLIHGESVSISASDSCLIRHIWQIFGSYKTRSDLADVSTEVTCIESFVYDVEAVTLLLLKSVSSNSSGMC